MIRPIRIRVINVFLGEKAKGEEQMDKELPCERKKRRIVWAGWLDNRQNSDAYVNRNANRDPRNHGFEDGMIDVPQQNKEAGEEKEDRKVQQGGHGVSCQQRVQVVGFTTKEFMHPCPVLWAAQWLGDLDVSTRPQL